MKIYHQLLTISLLLTFICISCQKDRNFEEPIIEISKIIGQSGGTIEVTNPSSPLFGVKIIIPQGALDKDTTITIKQIVSEPLIPNTVVQVSKTFLLGADNLFFHTPVLVTLPYNADDVKNENNIYVCTYNGSSWESVSLLSRDKDKNLITVQTTHFSDFTILEPKTTNNTGIIDTHFRPKSDGLQSDNSDFPYFPYLGKCFGMVSFAKWYFENKKQSLGDLKIRYNLYRDSVICDDAQSVLRLDVYFAGKYTGVVTDFIAAEFLKFSLEFNKTPQILLLSRKGNNVLHSVLVYKYDYDNGNFYIYDPNHPKDEIIINYDGVNLQNYDVYEDFTPLSSAFYNKKAMNCVFYSGTWDNFKIKVTEGTDSPSEGVLQNIIIKPNWNGDIFFSYFNYTINAYVDFNGSINNNTLTATSFNTVWWYWENGQRKYCSSGYTKLNVSFSDDKNGNGPFRAESCGPFDLYNAGTITLSRLWAR